MPGRRRSARRSRRRRRSAGLPGTPAPRVSAWSRSTSGRAAALPDDPERAVPAGLLGSDLEDANRFLAELDDLRAPALPAAVRGLVFDRPVDGERSAEHVARRP